jgi:hypothetical protein
MGTTSDRMLVDSGEGVYVWDYSQDTCPNMLVSLYRSRIKVLTNSTVPSQTVLPSCLEGTGTK